jgi:hypothetical protein
VVRTTLASSSESSPVVVRADRSMAVEDSEAGLGKSGPRWIPDKLRMVVCERTCEELPGSEPLYA